MLISHDEQQEQLKKRTTTQHRYKQLTTRAVKDLSYQGNQPRKPVGLKAPVKLLIQSNISNSKVIPLTDQSTQPTLRLISGSGLVIYTIHIPHNI
jgi:hypothetical protein